MLMSWLAQTVCELQSNGEDLALVTVLSKSGSAPCLAGAKMVVRADGTAIGTVGGGVLEAAAQKRGAQVLKSGLAEILSFELSGADAASMQMICGGSVKLLVDYLPASAANVAVFSLLRAALQNGEKCYLLAALGKDGAKQPTRRALVRTDGSLTGDSPFPHPWLERLLAQASRSTYPVVEIIDEERFVIERCFVPSTIFLCGAGHVSQQVAMLAEMTGFRTLVLDDRDEYANPKRFPSADAIRVLDSFAECFAEEAPDGDGYVVIVTRGHRYDRTVLAQALRTRAGYIGMLGSRRKREELFRALQQEEGFSAVELERVRCPIGLPIQAATPGEIAVSIVAELIQARAQAGGR